MLVSTLAFVFPVRFTEIHDLCKRGLEVLGHLRNACITNADNVVFQAKLVKVGVKLDYLPFLRNISALLILYLRYQPFQDRLDFVRTAKTPGGQENGRVDDRRWGSGFKFVADRSRPGAAILAKQAIGVEIVDRCDKLAD